MTDNVQFDWQQTFREVNRVQIGERGNLTVQEEDTRTDLDNLTEIHEERIPICSCGVDLRGDDGDVMRVFRCVECGGLACLLCVIRRERRSYCLFCAERAYQLDKYVYLALYYLRKGIAQPADFLQVDTVDDEPVTVAVDHAGSVMVDMDYVDTETGEVTPQGHDALAVGDKLYGDDADVQDVKQRVRIQEVANGR